MQNAIFEESKNREVAFRFGDYFGKRPNILNYPSDLKFLAEKGLTSVHFSIERWQDPLLLDNKKVNLNELRIGYDLVIDIDYDYLEYSYIAAKTIVKFLEENYNIKNVGIKYSGNKGFHLAISWESFPLTYKGEETKVLFPSLPRALLEFIFEKTKESIAKNILIEEGLFYKAEDIIDDISKKISIERLANNISFNSIKKIEKDLKENPDLLKKIVKGLIKKIFEKYNDEKEILEKVSKVLSVYLLVPKIDSIVVSSRHLIRAPYSYNEKSGLISVPIDRETFLKVKTSEIKEFLLEISKPKNVIVNKNFFGFVEKKVRILSLIEDALRFKEQNEIKKNEELLKKLTKDSEQSSNRLNKKIKEEFFPPCIKNILRGLEDGKKRALFILMNFLYYSGYSVEEIEKIIWDWNKRNKVPLKDNYIKSQLKWFRKITAKGRFYLLPNCDKKDYYQDIGICKPDNLCKKIKNPLTYVKKKVNEENNSNKS